ncbi:hypothetical protein ACHAXM_009619 [Skeletonema potamos]|jgi:hypothetical protein
MIQQNINVLPQEDQTRSNTSNNIALGIIGGGFVTIVALTSPFITMQLKSSLPYMSTPRQKVEKALTFLSNRNKRMIEKTYESKNHLDTTRITSRHAATANQEKQLNFVDLGSGDGTAVLAAASLGWRATGIEMNPTLWFVSSIRRLLTNNKESRINSQLKIGDMFDASTSQSILQKANCTMIFGVAPLMPRIANLIERECQPGCWIMSYRFRVPLATSRLGGIHAALIYDEEEMRIYELVNSDDKTKEDKLKNQ